MIKIQNIDIFIDILSKLDKEQYQLLGNAGEYGSGLTTFNSENTKTKLTARIVALTPIGTLFFSQSIKLSEEASVSDLKKKLELLSITEAGIRFDSSSGTITIV